MSDNNNEILTKNFNMIENSMAKMWDMWLGSLRSFSCNQEQIENINRKQLAFNQSAREELIKQVEDMGQEARIYQGQIHKMIEQTVMNTHEHLNNTSQSIMSDLTAKIDESFTRVVTKKVAELEETKQSPSARRVKTKKVAELEELQPPLSAVNEA